MERSTSRNNKDAPEKRGKPIRLAERLVRDAPRRKLERLQREFEATTDEALLLRQLGNDAARIFLNVWIDPDEDSALYDDFWYDLAGIKRPSGAFVARLIVALVKSFKSQQRLAVGLRHVPGDAPHLRRVL